MLIGGFCRVGVLASLVAQAATASTHLASTARLGSIGVLDQPCAAPSAPAPRLKELQDWLLDPAAREQGEAPEAKVLADIQAAEDERLHEDWASLCHYRMENAALARSPEARVVFVGDSITELWKTAHPQFFTAGFVDRGISGQTTAQVLVRFRQDVLALRPAVVHLMAGLNDIAGNAGPTSLEAVKGNIMSMVDLARANDLQVVLASVTPASSFPGRPAIVEPARHIVELNSWLRRYARERSLVYVDYHEALADERDGMKETFSNDGVHPNRDGYTVMEPLARHAIAEALKTLSAGKSTKSRSRPER